MSVAKQVRGQRADSVPNSVNEWTAVSVADSQLRRRNR